MIRPNKKPLPSRLKNIPCPVAAVGAYYVFVQVTIWIQVLFCLIQSQAHDKVPSEPRTLSIRFGYKPHKQCRLMLRCRDRRSPHRLLQRHQSCCGNVRAPRTVRFPCTATLATDWASDRAFSIPLPFALPLIVSDAVDCCVTLELFLLLPSPCPSRHRHCLPGMIPVPAQCHYTTLGPRLNLMWGQSSRYKLSGIR